MNKTTLLSIGGIIIIVAAIVIWQVAKKPQNVVVTSETQTTTEPSGKKMSFEMFTKQGGSYQCSVTQYLDQGMTQTTQGKVFLDNGKIRGDYATQVQGMNIDSSVIVKDGFAYAWTSMSKTGYKIAIKPVEGDNVATASGSYGWNTQQIGDYDCDPWTPDASKFTPPASITFTAVGQ